MIGRVQLGAELLKHIRRKVAGTADSWARVAAIQSLEDLEPGLSAARRNIATLAASGSTSFAHLLPELARIECDLERVLKEPSDHSDFVFADIQGQALVAWVKVKALLRLLPKASLNSEHLTGADSATLVKQALAIRKKLVNFSPDSLPIPDQVDSRGNNYPFSPLRAEALVRANRAVEAAESLRARWVSEKSCTITDYNRVELEVFEAKRLQRMVSATLVHEMLTKISRSTEDSFTR